MSRKMSLQECQLAQEAKDMASFQWKDSNCGLSKNRSIAICSYWNKFYTWAIILQQ